MNDNIKYLAKDHFAQVLRDHFIDTTGAHYERLSSKAMKVITNKGQFAGVHIIYVDTIVFSLIDGRVKLNNGGWSTNTTKKWINYGLDQYYSKYYISQKNWAWYLVNSSTGEKQEFKNLMQLA